MAEEIISVWNNVDDLVAELVASNDAERKTLGRVRETTEPLQMLFSLRDSEGNVVKWPITLISDTVTATSEP